MSLVTAIAGVPTVLLLLISHLLLAFLAAAAVPGVPAFADVRIVLFGALLLLVFPLLRLSLLLLLFICTQK
jgi:hypothetical protein